MLQLQSVDTGLLIIYINMADTEINSLLIILMKLCFAEKENYDHFFIVILFFYCCENFTRGN